MLPHYFNQEWHTDIWEHYSYSLLKYTYLGSVGT